MMDWCGWQTVCVDGASSRLSCSTEPSTWCSLGWIHLGKKRRGEVPKLAEGFGSLKVQRPISANWDPLWHTKNGARLRDSVILGLKKCPT